MTTRGRPTERQAYLALVIGSFVAFLTGVGLTFGLGWALIAAGLPAAAVGMVGLGLSPGRGR